MPVDLFVSASSPLALFSSPKRLEGLGQTLESLRVIEGGSTRARVAHRVQTASTARSPPRGAFRCLSEARTSLELPRDICQVSQCCIEAQSKRLFYFTPSSWSSSTTFIRRISHAAVPKPVGVQKSKPGLAQRPHNQTHHLLADSN